MTDELNPAVPAAPQGNETPASQAVGTASAEIPVSSVPAAAVPAAVPQPPVTETPPQPDAAAAPVVAAQTPAPEVPQGETLIQKAEDEGEAVVLDTAAGIIHAHGMVSTWLQRVEAGLHVPLDELRALKARLEKWL